MLAAIRDCVKLVFGLGVLAIICLGWAPFAWILCRLRMSNGGQVGRRFITVSIRLYLRALEAVGAMRFDIGSLDALSDNDAPMIIAPNHPRLLDAFLVVSRLSNVVCIMKSGINDNLFLGQAARLAGYISNESPVQMIRDSMRALKRGNHLLLFPEGTRTVREPVNPMTPAVGLIASRAGVPVQTVFIECDSPYLRKGWPLMRRARLPIHFRVRLGKRFDSPTDARAFTTMLEQYFVDALAPGRGMNGSAHATVNGLAGAVATTHARTRDAVDGVGAVGAVGAMGNVGAIVAIAPSPEPASAARPVLAPITANPSAIESHST